MRIPRQRIEKVCSKENEHREYLKYVYFDAANDRLIASNGKVAAVVPVKETENDKSCMIPPQSLSRNRPRKKFYIADVRVEKNAVTNPDGTVTVVHDGIDDVWGRSKIDDIIPKPPRRVPDLVIDARLLLQLAEAINGDDKKTGIKLWLSRPGEAGIIYAQAPLDASGAYGVIMPLTDFTSGYKDVDREVGKDILTERPVGKRKALRV